MSSADFERALESSLNDAGLASVNRQGSKYVLTAHLANEGAVRENLKQLIDALVGLKL